MNNMILSRYNHYMNMFLADPKRCGEIDLEAVEVAAIRAMLEAITGTSEPSLELTINVSDIVDFLEELDHQANK